MYIEEIIIDGFKSYATRTVVSGFDPNFNAITGLNGSGKSNILDSICFVLGISNLSQVRVNNLQELVYKQGQAGVTKASVSIVFNNDDKKASPVGYEQYNKITVTRQVVIGGRNKYLINGHNAQLNRVQNLFHSVQLNVNNPHFLIMQGRITKVLNMKPPETLAMIEEAAGTRMFEMKKISALKTIEKKQKKVDEIQRVLEEEITPTLENLRKERSQYIQWSNNQTQLERVSRFCIAYDFYKSEETLKRSADELNGMKSSAKELEGKKEEWNQLITQNKTKINKLTERKEKEMDGDLKKLDTKVEELSKEYVKQTSAFRHKNEQLDQEKAQKVNLKKNTGESKATLEQKRGDKAKIDAIFAVTDEENKKLSTLLKDLQRQLQAVSAGIGSEPGDSGSLEGMLLEAKREASQASTETKQAQIRIQHLTAELASKKKDVQHSGSESAKLQAEHEAALKALNQIQKSLDSFKFDEQEERTLLERRREEEHAVAELREKVDHLAAGLSRLQFVYNDPEKNFDRRKVKGLVANLITLTDTTMATALERTAGGKLRNVVVDNEVTGKALLSKGGLRERVTIIPLNKINNRTVDAAKVRAAQEVVGPENVTLALSLVKYDKEVQNAMNYVFGSTLICKQPSHAKQVTFDQRVRTRSVTVEGDVYDPQGTLTGGSHNSGPSDLVRLQSLNAARAALQQREATLADIVARLSALKDAADKYRQLKQQIALRQHEVDLVKARMAQNPHYQLIERVHAIETQLKENEEAIEEWKRKERAANDRHKELEQNSKGFASRRDSRLKGIETQIADTKVTLARSTTKLKAQQEDQETLGLEIMELEAELNTLEQQGSGADGSIARLEKEVLDLGEKANRTKTEHEVLHADVEKKREKIQSQSKAIQELIHENDKHQKRVGDADLELKTLEHNISRFESSRKDASRFVQKMLSQHAWISAEKQFFGVAKTDYDFSSTNPAEANKRLGQLQEEQDRLTKSLNKKVMSMFEKAEQEYKELMHKKTIIENDKSKIEAVIAELDEKKNEALSTTWQKVNRDFGSIFGTLLPGTKAKLEPPHGQSVLDGLEVKVAFGEVWKDSLTELSGGQRSLLALSLILALLLFKPAPMYILDEIDAALDLSHTQNIGQMLKAHFTHSQFIIVSLKEGMFSNANVLFQTKFVEGVSTVSRTIPNKDNNKENIRPTKHK